MGRYSSLEITWVGTGRWRSSHASRSDLRIHPLWTGGFEQDGTVFGLGIFNHRHNRIFIGQRLLRHDSVYNCLCPHLPRMASCQFERWVRSNKLLPRKLEPLNLDAKQTSIPSAVKYVHNSSFVGGPTNEDYPEKARKKRERS